MSRRGNAPWVAGHCRREKVDPSLSLGECILLPQGCSSGSIQLGGARQIRLCTCTSVSHIQVVVTFIGQLSQQRWQCEYTMSRVNIEVALTLLQSMS